jgi:hypothetical protein
MIRSSNWSTSHELDAVIAIASIPQIQTLGLISGHFHRKIGSPFGNKNMCQLFSEGQGSDFRFAFEFLRAKWGMNGVTTN